MFSELIVAQPSPNNTADIVCDALLSYFTTHGLFDIARIDPGSNLLAEAVQLVNKLFDISQTVSLVDVHTSNRVENGGVKAIIRHLQALCSDFRIKDRWSEPKYLQYVLLMLNSSHNIKDIPIRLHYGDFDSMQAKYKDNLFIDPTTRNAFMKDLYKLQKIANE